MVRPLVAVEVVAATVPALRASPQVAVGHWNRHWQFRLERLTRSRLVAVAQRVLAEPQTPVARTAVTVCSRRLLLRAAVLDVPTWVRLLVLVVLMVAQAVEEVRHGQLHRPKV